MDGTRLPLRKRLVRWLDRFDPPPDPTAPDPTTADPTTYDPFGSQKGQVDFVLLQVFNYARNGLKRNGFFVDLAASDGVHVSNTLFLEKHLGWRGILIEPNPSYHASILANRSSPLVKKVITSRSGDRVDFRVDNAELGGIVGDAFDNNRSIRGAELESATIVALETQNLLEVLESHSAPAVIDYLSLDVEGAEYEVLRNFDFDRYTFRCMTVERPPLELDLLLDSAGYIQVQHAMFDTFYIHTGFLAEADLRSTPVFRATPRKDW